MTFGSLFAGIGGFDLGLERAGMTCKWQVEIDPYAIRVLEKHWPNVRRWDDVRTFPPEGDWAVDLVCGGFPCQPISTAGRQCGSNDERWLWPEFARILSVLRPRYALLENTPGLLVRGFDAVLGDLASLGYDAEWSIVSACSMGAPHMRKRMFIIANSNPKRWSTLGQYTNESYEVRVEWNGKANASLSEWGQVQRWIGETFHDGNWSPTEGIVRRMDDGVPYRVDRIRCLGNAVVPQVAEWIGRRIMEHVTFTPGILK